MVVGHFGGVGRLRGELRLKAEGNASDIVGIFLETEVFFEDPEDVGGKTTLLQKAFPGGQGVFIGRALVSVGVLHSRVTRVTRVAWLHELHGPWEDVR